MEIQEDGETYKLEWVRAAGRGRYNRVAIRTNDVLSNCYSYRVPGERGVGDFKITSGPRLVDEWATLRGDGKLYRDTWTAER